MFFTTRKWVNAEKCESKFIKNDAIVAFHVRLRQATHSHINKWERENDSSWISTWVMAFKNASWHEAWKLTCVCIKLVEQNKRQQRILFSAILVRTVLCTWCSHDGWESFPLIDSMTQCISQKYSFTLSVYFPFPSLFLSHSVNALQQNELLTCLKHSTANARTRCIHAWKWKCITEYSFELLPPSRRSQNTPVSSSNKLFRYVLPKCAAANCSEREVN